MKTALIIGSEGQDGRLLKRLLEIKQYNVFGIGRKLNANSASAKNFIEFDLAGDDFTTLENFISEYKPAEIYYVAAFHQSSQEENKAVDFSFIDRSVKVNQTGFMRVLEICRLRSAQSRIIYTSSSLIFSGSADQKQNEETIPEPRCIYSVTKCAAMEAAKFYRNIYNLYVSVGIMYNHESVYRNDYFLSKKIVNETRLLVEKKINSITVGDLSSVTDWGYAPDYVEGMWHILQLPDAGVFIISSGEPHTVQNWFEVLFEHIGMDWKPYVKENKALIIRKKPVLIGNNAKLLASGWLPKVSFNEMIIRMYNNTI